MKRMKCKERKVERQIERQVVINYRWWRLEDGKPVRKADRKNLESLALEVIASRMKEGFVCGELNDFISDVQYRGYWEAKKS